MLKLLLFTGICNAELVRLRLRDVDLQTCQVRIAQGKGQKDRSVLFPTDSSPLISMHHTTAVTWLQG